MKRIILLLFAICFACLGANAQQQQQERRVKSLYLYPEFKEATVLQTFGRKLKAKANIFLEDGSLVYIDEKDGKTKRAYLDNILGVVFDDSVRYMKVDSVMGRVVAQKGYNYLLCNTHVNQKRMQEEFETNQTLEMAGIINRAKRDDEQGYLLTDTYYFQIGTEVIKANESKFKHFVSKDQQQAFKVLMANRFWSWRDPESLEMLLDFLPQH